MRVVWIALALIISWTPYAVAQSSPPALTPPRITSEEKVPYPESARGDAVVVLELLIDVTGSVKEAKVVDGEEPFATAARDAAIRWNFVPARRGELNVAARVRMRIEFHPPTEPTSDSPEKAPGPSAASPSDSTPPAPSAPATHSEQPPVQEVKVRGARPEAGKITVGGGEVRQVPGAFGDAFRMMEALPGVTPVFSGLPFFFVRGAPPGDTGYFLDGVRVPLLYHLAAGPSVIHPALVDHVDFFPGGYPAQYGRFAGGILAGYTRPPADAFHADWNLRLLDAGALVEAPFADGRGTVMAGGRYGYPGLLLPLFAPKSRLSYWDYQARVAWKFDERNSISAFWFGSYDYLAEVKTADTGEKYTEQLFATMFHRLDLRFDHKLEHAGNIRLALTLGTDKSGADTGDATSKMIGFRAEVDHRLSEDVRTRLGADVFFEHFDVLDEQGNRNVSGNSASTLYAPRNDVTIGAHADLVWRLSPRVEVVPGLRGDIFTSRRIDRTPALYEPPSTAVGIDPRLALRVMLTPKWTWVSTFGISHQPPSLVVPIPGAGLAKLGDGLQTSVQTSEGVEILLPGDFTATGNLFLHNFLDLTDATATCVQGEINDGQFDPSSPRSCIGRRVRGRSFGLELLVKRALTKRITGWISYTLSRTTRDTDPNVSSRLRPFIPTQAATILGEFDRTHVLNVIGAYDLGAGWRAGGRFYFYSGRPYSQQYYGFAVPPYNNERLPSYFRIDLRLEKMWPIGKTGRISFVLEGLNVTLNKEVIGLECKTTPGAPSPLTVPPLQSIPKAWLDQCSAQEVGPVAVPSVGLEGAF